MSFLIEKIIFPFADLIMSTKIMHYLKVISKMNNWDNDDLINWQNKKTYMGP